MVRCTAVPDTRCELIQSSPSWFPVVIRVPTRSPCYPKAEIVANNKARIFLPTADRDFTNKAQMVRRHNEFMQEKCARIVELADKARGYLKQLLIP
jgi:hypothetical protein